MVEVKLCCAWLKLELTASCSHCTIASEVQEEMIEVGDEKDCTYRVSCSNELVDV